MTESAAKHDSALEARRAELEKSFVEKLAASEAVQVAALEALRLGLASPAVGPVSSREEMVRGVAGSAARRLDMAGVGVEEGIPVDGEAGRSAEAGVGAEEGVPVDGEAGRTAEAGVGAEEGVPVNGEVGCTAEAGVGAEEGVPVVRLWSTLQRVPGVNVGEDGVGGHSVPGNGRHTPSIPVLLFPMDQ